VSSRTRRVVLPTIKPIIVVAGSPPLHDPRWIYEPKFDGFRGVLYLCRGECYIRSKRGNVLSRFKDLALRVGPSSTPGRLFSTARSSRWMTKAEWIFEACSRAARRTAGN
jgi:hypothetical protein